MGNPKFDTGHSRDEDSVQSFKAGIDRSNDLDALDDLQLDQSDFRNRVDDVRHDTKAYGFEAIAWFQPYHVWTEETWGIYFDARKLDDLALSFLDDFKSARVHGSHSLAAPLAFGLTYAHELFHARVEAALSWLEINALQPRHLRYKQRVYDALRETPDWLEEALANWSAWDWFSPSQSSALFSRRMANARWPAKSRRVVARPLATGLPRLACRAPARHVAHIRQRSSARATQSHRHRHRPAT